MKQQILEILNRGGVHIPTVGEWMEIAELVTSDDLGEDANDSANFLTHQDGVCIRLQQRFEELTRGIEIGNFPQDKSINQIFYEWQPVILKREMFEDEDAWFESKLATMQFPDNAELWYWIIEMGRIKSSWSFTENFVKLLK